MATFYLSSTFVFNLGTIIIPQINLTAYKTATGQSFISDSEEAKISSAWPVTKGR